MKIKHDFVTNSSSCSYTFIFKGDKLDLFKNLLSIQELFNLSSSWEENVYINVWDVIRAIDANVKTDVASDDKLWILPRIMPIEDLKEKTIKDIDEFIPYAEENPKDQFYHSFVVKLKRDLETINGAIENGLTSYLDIDFGNDGFISGHIGDIMRSESVTYDASNFVILTNENS